MDCPFSQSFAILFQMDRPFSQSFAILCQMDRPFCQSFAILCQMDPSFSQSFAILCQTDCPFALVSSWGASCIYVPNGPSIWDVLISTFDPCKWTVLLASLTRKAAANGPSFCPGAAVMCLCVVLSVTSCNGLQVTVDVTTVLSVRGCSLLQALRR